MHPGDSCQGGDGPAPDTHTQCTAVDPREGPAQGPPHEEDDTGPKGLGRGYLRVVGVGIVVPPGSVQREQHSWARGPATRWAEGSTQPAGRGLLLSVLGRALARGWTGQEDLPCPKGWLGSVVENQDPRPLPEPSPSLLLEGGGGGERAWGSRAFEQSHTHTRRETYTHLHIHTQTHTCGYTLTHRHPPSHAHK